MIKDITHGAQDLFMNPVHQRIKIDEGRIIYAGGDPYTGEYEVTPQAYESVTLYTNGKIMGADITVHEVPYYETSNISGTTVYIASEVN